MRGNTQVQRLWSSTTGVNVAVLILHSGFSSPGDFLLSLPGVIYEDLHLVLLTLEKNATYFCAKYYSLIVVIFRVATFK